MLLCAAPSNAAENEATNATPKIDNVGFMKNPPKELVDRFPMCDAFLNVKWIDEDRAIGFSKYTLYGDDGSIIINVIPAIVYLNPSLIRYDYIGKVWNSTMNDWAIEKSMTDPELHNYFADIKSSKVSLSGSTPSFDGEALDLVSTYFEKFTKTKWPSSYSLAKNSMSICIPYPGMDRVWIVEHKQISSFMDNGEIEKLAANIRISNYKNMSMQQMENNLGLS